LSDQEHEYRGLEEGLAKKRDEFESARSELDGLGHAHESLKAARSMKQRMLAQATTDIQELEKLAKELPVRLHRTAFDSKDASIMTMLRSFHQDILEKLHGAGGAELSKVMEKRPVTAQQLDDDTKEKLGSVLHRLRLHDSYRIFAHPVTKDVAPGYFEVIKHPMDLSTMRRKSESNRYTSISDFVADATLMFDNCRTYNVRVRSYIRAADAIEEQMQLLMMRRELDWFR
jgi:Bromodomain